MLNRLKNKKDETEAKREEKKEEKAEAKAEKQAEKTGEAPAFIGGTSAPLDAPGTGKCCMIIMSAEKVLTNS